MDEIVIFGDPSDPKYAANDVHIYTTDDDGHVRFFITAYGGLDHVRKHMENIRAGRVTVVHRPQVQEALWSE